MIVSIAEDMNPTRRNTMEDVHVFHAPSSWGSPNALASFVGVYDGHGGRLIVDYLEDHLAENVAKEWSNLHSKKIQNDKRTKIEDALLRKKRRLELGASENYKSENDFGEENNNDVEDGEIIRTSLETAFLLTDIQSSMAGLKTSGATVVCCIIIPQFADGNLSSISIHAANAGDARAVVSSCRARRSADRSSVPSSDRSSPSKWPNRRCNSAVRITSDHKSTDPKEISRIESSGGTMIRGRVLGVLAVARSLGDHGLKEFVIGRPYLSSTVVHIESCKPTTDAIEDVNGKKKADSKVSLSHPFTDGEFLIVACDGLWDVVEDQEAVSLVRDFIDDNTSSKTLCERKERAASMLVDEALRRGSMDNITAIVFWL